MRIKAAIVFLSVFFSQFSLAAGDVRVLASIKPLQLIATDIVGDAGSVELLLKPGASPHHYSMKPSDIRKLVDSKLVIWVGPELEQFLEKSLRNRNGAALAMVTEGEAGHHEEHDEHDEHASHDKHESHDEHHEEHDEHGHKAHADEHDDHAHEREHHHDHEDDGHDTHADHDEEADAHAGHNHEHGEDVHLWLDPISSLEFAERLKDRLSELYPQQAAQFAANYEQFEAEIRSMDAQLKSDLKPIQSRGFFVFHDAWGHFVEHYGLNQLGYFTVDPGRKPGARHLTEIREQLEAKQAVCVFSEPQFKPAIIRAVTSGLDVGQGEIDPLAGNVSADRGGYARYIKGVAKQFVSCLSAR